MHKLFDSAKNGGNEKRPYVKPAIVFKEALETLAVACNPSPPGKGSPMSCPLGPINS